MWMCKIRVQIEYGLIKTIPFGVYLLENGNCTQFNQFQITIFHQISVIV